MKKLKNGNFELFLPSSAEKFLAIFGAVILLNPTPVVVIAVRMDWLVDTLRLAPDTGLNFWLVLLISF